MESIYQERYPSTAPAESLLSMQSDTLVFDLDPGKYCLENGNQTSVTYNVMGVGDFGQDIEKVSIWQEKIDYKSLTLIHLQDDVREWNKLFKTCLITIDHR